MWNPPRLVAAMLALLATMPDVSQSFCPAACRCSDSELAAWCPHAQLGIVPITLNPGIRVLDLENNRIRDLSNALQFYSELETLNLSKNQISDLMDLHFEAQTKLRHLHLSHNDVESLHVDTFVGLEALRTLDLSRNGIRQLGPDAFRDLGNVEMLDLSGNRIDSLDSVAFRGLERIRVLRLRENKLSTICGIVTNLHSLEELDVGGNPLMFPGLQPDHVGCFASWAPNLSWLDLSGTRLPSLPRDLVVGLTRLRVLKLAHCGLTRVCAHEWDSPELHELHLGNNPIPVLQTGCFRGLQNLKVLDLSWSPELISIESKAFSANPELHALSLDHSPKLRHVAPASLPPQSRVSLRHCASLRTLPPSPDIAAIDLIGTPLECNCSVSWLWTRDANDASDRDQTRNDSNNNSKNISNDNNNNNLTNGVTCAGPSEFRGRALSSLRRPDLGCSRAELWVLLLGGGAVMAAVILVAVGAGAWHAVRTRHHHQHQQENQQQRRRSGKPCGAGLRIVAPRKDECPEIFFVGNNGCDGGGGGLGRIGGGGADDVVCYVGGTCRRLTTTLAGVHHQHQHQHPQQHHQTATLASEDLVRKWHTSPWTIFEKEEYIYRTPDGSNAIIPVTEL